ncbi:transcription initiation factor IIA large subunit [Amborella trichopoda]|uniref:transcription initiation factor IIA large subunit n=1 Tax=Amborella trichopoda TaxID=13333 RepID=UPI0005D340C4|nr:transcription initiation factor IIA large subunit [Amborella trichopoda]|eukprot:XP_006827510.2 transcription initiation factor IIA large subunit [Amborella trichopoda]
MATNVSAVYLYVVDSVVNKLREEFVNEGVDESVLNELQALWELKLMQRGAIKGVIERSPAPGGAGSVTPVHDLNVPYEGLEEYETPTAEMLFPPTPIQTPIPTPLPGESAGYPHFPSGPGEYGSLPDIGSSIDIKTGMPAPYMQQPSPWMNQRPLGVDVNVAYEEGRDEEGGISRAPLTKDFFITSSKRKRDDFNTHFLQGGYIPQQDGAGDVTCGLSQQEKIAPANDPLKGVSQARPMQLRMQECKKADSMIASLIRMKQMEPTIPQRDGSHDGYDDGFGEEDYNTPYYDPQSSHVVGTPKPMKPETHEDDEPPLNEDDDDDLDDGDNGDEEPSTDDLVLAQFEKVSRTKSRWKCILKDGIMRLNNRDFLFNKATGEFEF